jgi:hypothetical protein
VLPLQREAQHGEWQSRHSHDAEFNDSAAPARGRESYTMAVKKTVAKAKKPAKKAAKPAKKAAKKATKKK